jgi:hypothetical protein
MSAFNMARARFLGVMIVALILGPRAALAQTDPVVSRPWSCFTASIAEQSIFRPPSRPVECGEQTPPITLRMGSRIRTRDAAALVAPTAPTALVAAVSGTTVVLTWTAPAVGDPPASYVLEAGSASGLANQANSDTGSTTPALTATAVGAGTYYVRVRAKNASGVSAPSNEIVVTVAGPCATVAGPPAGLGATVSGGNITLTWQAPTGGCAPGSYQIEAGSAAGLTNLASLQTGNTSTTFFAFNIGAGSYFVRVKSVNAGGVSSPSNEIQFNVGGCAGAPTAPGGLAAQITGSTVVLTWAAASGSPASYVLEAGSSSGATDIVVSDTGGTATTLTASAGPGTYYVRVRAKNACGQSTVSNEIIVVIGTGGGSCATISPSSQTFGSAAALGSVTVTAPAPCAWTAVSNAAFITVTVGASGTGAGTVNYSVAANDTGSTRSGTLTIANQTFTVTQQLCTYTLSPPTMLVADAGGIFTITMTTGSACTWNATSNASFIALTSPSLSSGSTPVTINVSANAGAGRGGTLTIGDQTVTVVQTGPSGFASCGASIVRCAVGSGPGCFDQTFTSTGGTAELNFLAPVTCAWMASSTVPWVSLYSTSAANQPFGLGNGHFGFSVAQNLTGAQRVGTIVGGGGTFTVTETACSFTVSPATATVSAGGATGTISVTTSCTDTWTATSNAAFITIGGGSSGSGNGSVTITIAPNTGAARSGTLTIAGQTVTITQQAP